MTSVEEIIKNVEPPIREKIRRLIIRKLSIWNADTNLSEVIDEETENLMMVIRPALRRAGEADDQRLQTKKKT